MFRKASMRVLKNVACESEAYTQLKVLTSKASLASWHSLPVFKPRNPKAPKPESLQ